MTMTEPMKTLSNVAIDDHDDLKITLERPDHDEAAVLHLAGLIDTYNSNHFREQATRVVDAGYRHLIIDATATTFMSSTGIGAFTALLKVVKERGGSLVIYGMPTKIFEVFQLLGFSSFFIFCDSLDEAVGLLGVESRPTVAFPVVFTCPVCQKKLKAGRAGRFRCSNCRVILAVDEEGGVHLG